MPIMSKPSSAPRISITFITLGVIMAIPSGVYLAMFHPANLAQFVCVSLFGVGLAFLVIGLSVGYISRTARKAELPPTEAMGTVAHQDQALANRGATPNGYPATTISV